MKKILVLPVKNEEWILEKFLEINSLWADHIIIADQNSTDKTLEICKKFSKVIVIKNEAKFHSSSVRKLLLDTARQFDGNNIIFSFDADEIPTTHILNNAFWSKVATLTPGSAIMLQWINLWRSQYKYRNDNSIWSDCWKHFGFIDDRICDFTNVGVINDHTSRIPLVCLENTVTFELPKIMHFQFVNWQRMLSKQCYYVISEAMHKKNSALDIVKINRKYFATHDERNILLDNVPEDWFGTYELNFDLVENSKSINWYDYEVLKILNNNTTKFAWYDIWDIDWEEKRQIAIEKGHKLEIPDLEIKDPRNILQKFYHSTMQRFISDNSIIYKIFKFFKK